MPDLNLEHVTDTLVSAFPVPDEAWLDEDLIESSGQLMQKLKGDATRKTITSRQAKRVDIIEYDEYNAGACKGIIDAIDRRLGFLLDLTPLEIDAITTIDLKFRAGSEIAGLTSD